MKSLSQTQFFVAGIVLVLVLALVAVLAEGLKRYDTEVYSAEQSIEESNKAIPPSTPEAVVGELRMEDMDASQSAEAELKAENEAIQAENRELTTVTQSYE
jgi:cell division protein FtsB